MGEAGKEAGGGKGAQAVRRAVWREAVASYFYVGQWMTVSISVIIFNKWLLAYAGFHYPITLTMWHMFFCSTIAFFVIRVFGLVKSFDMSAREYLQRVMPIGALYALSLWLSNSAYLYLSVSFIQMTKSLMPGLVYTVGVILQTESFGWGQALNMLLIAFGVLVCAFGEVNLVPIGVVEQLLAMSFEATRLTLIQLLINSRGYKMNPTQSLYYISPACFACLSVPFVALEMKPVLNLINTGGLKFRPEYLLANACTAFFLNLAVFLLIGKTSALTMNIAGVIKDWLLIWFSFSVFKAPVTALNLAGYIFCCSGVAVYNYQKLQKIKADQKKKLAGGDVEGGAAKKGEASK